MTGGGAAGAGAGAAGLTGAAGAGAADGAGGFPADGWIPAPEAILFHIASLSLNEDIMKCSAVERCGLLHRGGLGLDISHIVCEIFNL